MTLKATYTQQEVREMLQSLQYSMKIAQEASAARYNQSTSGYWEGFNEGEAAGMGDAIKLVRVAMIEITPFHMLDAIA